MFAKSNKEIIQTILDQIEDQLLVVGRDIPDTATESVRSRILLESLPGIVEELGWSLDLTSTR